MQCSSCRQPERKRDAKPSKKAAGQASSAAAGERLPTEDDFLRLEDMEQFVQDAEEDAMEGNASEEDPEGDDEGSDDDDDLG